MNDKEPEVRVYEGYAARRWQLLSDLKTHGAKHSRTVADFSRGITEAREFVVNKPLGSRVALIEQYESGRCVVSGFFGFMNPDQVMLGGTMEQSVRLVERMLKPYLPKESEE